MKTRTDYVSNSSSSSFILKESDATKSLTGADWNRMIVDLYENYEEQLAECRRIDEEYDVKERRHPIYCAFDLRTDREEAEEYLKHILEGWIAYHCVMRNGKVETTDKDVEDEWKKYCDHIENLINKWYEGKCMWSNVWLSCNTRKDIREEQQTVNFRTKVGGEVKTVPVGEKYLKLLERKWDRLGVCDNYDVLRSDKARFAVHFDENDYCNIRGMGEENGEWDTESYTYDRLCEVFARWLVEHGKVPSGFTWRNLVDDTLTVNMHEG